MNARAVFNRSEAVLEYRPTPTLDGSYSWYWILLSAQDTCLGSGTAPNRAKASVQARLKARQLGRHISKVRIAGSQQEGLQRPIAAKDFIMQQKPGPDTPCGEPCYLCGKPCTLVHRGTLSHLVSGDTGHICQTCDEARFGAMLPEAASPKDFILAQPDDRRYRVVLVKPNGWRYYYTGDAPPGETAPQWCGGNPAAQWFDANSADRAMPLTADEAEERAARCRRLRAAQTLRWEVKVEPIPVTEAAPPPARDFILQNPSWEIRLEQFTGPPKPHVNNDPEMKKAACYRLSRSWQSQRAAPDGTLTFQVIVVFLAGSNEIAATTLKLDFWKAATHGYKDLEDSEYYYGDMNQLMDRLEPVLQAVAQWKRPPTHALVQQTFSPFLRWVYENPGQVKI